MLERFDLKNALRKDLFKNFDYNFKSCWKNHEKPNILKGRH